MKECSFLHEQKNCNYEEEVCALPCMEAGGYLGKELKSTPYHSSSLPPDGGFHAAIMFHVDAAGFSTFTISFTSPKNMVFDISTFHRRRESGKATVQLDRKNAEILAKSETEHGLKWRIGTGFVANSSNVFSIGKLEHESCLLVSIPEFSGADKTSLVSAGAHQISVDSSDLRSGVLHICLQNNCQNGPPAKKCKSIGEGPKGTNSSSGTYFSDANSADRNSVIVSSNDVDNEGSTREQDTRAGLPLAALVTIIVGSLFILALVVVFISMFLKRRKAARKKDANFSATDAIQLQEFHNVNESCGVVVNTQPLEQGWFEVIDPATGRVYYSNGYNTQWEPPTPALSNAHSHRR